MEINPLVPHQNVLYFYSDRWYTVYRILKCEPTSNRGALRTKLLDAQNFMQFDQAEFDRLWNLGMSMGNLK